MAWLRRLLRRDDNPVAEGVHQSKEETKELDPAVALHEKCSYMSATLASRPVGEDGLPRRGAALHKGGLTQGELERKNARNIRRDQHSAHLAEKKTFEARPRDPETGKVLATVADSSQRLARLSEPTASSACSTWKACRQQPEALEVRDGRRTRSASDDSQLPTSRRPIRNNAQLQLYAGGKTQKEVDEGFLHEYGRKSGGSCLTAERIKWDARAAANADRGSGPASTVAEPFRVSSATTQSSAASTWQATRGARGGDGGGGAAAGAPGVRSEEEGSAAALQDGRTHKEITDLFIRGDYDRRASRAALVEHRKVYEARPRDDFTGRVKNTESRPFAFPKFFTISSVYKGSKAKSLAGVGTAPLQLTAGKGGGGGDGNAGRLSKSEKGENKVGSGLVGWQGLTSAEMIEHRDTHMRRDGHADLAQQKEQWEERVLGHRHHHHDNSDDAYDDEGGHEIDYDNNGNWSTTPVCFNFHSDARAARKPQLPPTVYPSMMAFSSTTMSLPFSSPEKISRDSHDSVSLALTSEADAYHRRMRRKEQLLLSKEEAPLAITTQAHSSSSSLWRGLSGFSLGQRSSSRASSSATSIKDTAELSLAEEQDVEKALRRCLNKSSRSLDHARPTTLATLDEGGSFHERHKSSIGESFSDDDDSPNYLGGDDNGWSVASSYPSALLSHNTKSAGGCSQQQDNASSSSHSYDHALALVPASESWVAVASDSSSSRGSTNQPRAVFLSSHLNQITNYQENLRPSDEDRERTLAEFRARGAHEGMTTVPRAPTFASDLRTRADEDRHGFRGSRLARARTADCMAAAEGDSKSYFAWGRKAANAELAHESRLFEQRRQEAEREAAAGDADTGEGEGAGGKGETAGRGTTLTTKPSAFTFFHTSERAKARKTKKIKARQLLLLEAESNGGSNGSNNTALALALAEDGCDGMAEHITGAEQVNGYYTDYGRKKGSEALSLAAEEYAARKNKKTKPVAFSFFHTTQRAMTRAAAKPEVEPADHANIEESKLAQVDYGRKKGSEALSLAAEEYAARKDKITKPKAFSFFYTTQRALTRSRGKPEVDHASIVEHITGAEQVNGYYTDYGRKKGSEALSLAAKEYEARGEDKRTKPKAFSFFHTTQQALIRSRGKPPPLPEEETSKEHVDKFWKDVGRKRGAQSLALARTEYDARALRQQEEDGGGGGKTSGAPSTRPQPFNFLLSERKGDKAGKYSVARDGDPAWRDVAPEQRALEFQDIGRKRASAALKNEKELFEARRKVEDEAVRKHTTSRLRRRKEIAANTSKSPTATSTSSSAMTPDVSPTKDKPHKLIMDLDVGTDNGTGLGNESTIGAVDGLSSISRSSGGGVEKAYSRNTSASTSRVTQRRRDEKVRTEEMRRSNAEALLRRPKTPPPRRRAATSSPLPTRRPRKKQGVAI